MWAVGDGVGVTAGVGALNGVWDEHEGNLGDEKGSKKGTKGKQTRGVLLAEQKEGVGGGQNGECVKA